MQKYLTDFREMISLRGLTDHTIKSYSTYIRAYLDYLQNILLKLPEDVTWKELREFIYYLQNQRNLSDRTMNHCISQLRFFTLYVLHQPWDIYQLPMRKFDTYLPFVPTQKEVATFIYSITNLRVKAMVALAYSSGLRIGEICHLKYVDIQRENMRIHITHGKNRSDRFAILSEDALKILSEYWLAFGKPKNWLFPQVRGADKPIDTFYLSRHIASHEKLLSLEKQLSCHSFRHAFGTHLYENGADLLAIKSLLGHKSLNSTMIYVQLSTNGIHSAKSPFDCLGDNKNE